MSAASSQNKEVLRSQASVDRDSCLTNERSEKRKLFDYQESKRRREDLGVTFGNLVNSVVIDQK